MKTEPSIEDASHAASLDEGLVAHLEEAAAEAHDWHDVARRLRERLETSETDGVRWVRAAFDYGLTFERGSKESAFVPMFGYESGDSYPPSPEKVPVEARKVWEETLARVVHPINRARFAHLLVEASLENRHHHARVATRAYIECAEKLTDDLDRYQSLSCAHHLARAFNLNIELERVQAALIALAESSVNSSEKKPGVFIRALELIADLDEERVDATLDRARAICRDDPWNLQSVLQIARTRSKDEPTRRVIDRERVQAWLDQASRSDPLVRVMHLETAARLARDLGIKDLEQQAQVALQQTSPEDLGLQRIASEVEIPQEQVEQFLALYTDHKDWKEALAYFALSLPPTGSVDENRQTVQRHAKEFPLQGLMPKVKLGSDGLPRYSPQSEEEIEDSKLAEHELLLLQVQTGLLHTAFWRLWIRFGIPQDSEFVEFLMSLPGFDQDEASAFVYGFRKYQAGDDRAAGFVLTALTERLARNLVMRSGQGVYRVQRASQPGQYPGLGFLLRELRKIGMDESWYRFLWTFLASPAGANFRNELFHGFIASPSNGHVLLVLKAALYLGFLTTQQSASSVEGVSEENGAHNSAGEVEVAGVTWTIERGPQSFSPPEGEPYLGWRWGIRREDGEEREIEVVVHPSPTTDEGRAALESQGRSVVEAELDKDEPQESFEFRRGDGD